MRLCLCSYETKCLRQNKRRSRRQLKCISSGSADHPSQPQTRQIRIRKSRRLDLEILRGIHNLQPPCTKELIPLPGHLRWQWVVPTPTAATTTSSPLSSSRHREVAMTIPPPSGNTAGLPPPPRRQPPSPRLLPKHQVLHPRRHLRPAIGPSPPPATLCT
jgi:hypothetical protein